MIVHLTYNASGVKVMADSIPPGTTAAEEAAARLAVERQSMRSTPAQMRLALLQADLLDTVNTIAASDAAASEVWEYAVEIERLSPFIDALAEGAFTDAEIDDLFRAAMKVQL